MVANSCGGRITAACSAFMASGEKSELASALDLVVSSFEEERISFRLARNLPLDSDALSDQSYHEIITATSSTDITMATVHGRIHQIPIQGWEWFSLA